MKIQHVAVGSTNPVKINAVREALNQLRTQCTTDPQNLPFSILSEIDVVGIPVDSGVRAQPRTDTESIEGAMNRAARALATANADLGVGLEGNIVETDWGMFVTSWVVVVNAKGEAGIGGGGRLLLPDSVAVGIRQGQELGTLMDHLLGETHTKHKQGAVGILTHGVRCRTEAFTHGIIYAFAPLLNPDLYLLDSDS